jgi:hypothetical protein
MPPVLPGILITFPVTVPLGRQRGERLAKALYNPNAYCHNCAADACELLRSRFFLLGGKDQCCVILEGNRQRTLGVVGVQTDYEIVCYPG